MEKRYALLVDEVGIAMLNHLTGGKLQFVELQFMPLDGNPDLAVVVSPIARPMPTEEVEKPIACCESEIG